ncbi:hypothetical protein PVAP13_4KG220415 [Panicum virgatum]|uniref:Uncharacterized protein n=1 Tax=Panicum virgatum TaxID=38727 RepID=A0A8T0TSR4_PANVG|nr:hypothetical protein PVAP13_4KG220415 [Panicum virgatum]
MEEGVLRTLEARGRRSFSPPILYFWIRPCSLLLSGSSAHHVSSSSTKLKREKTARITPKGQQLQPSLNTFGIPVLRPSGLRVTWALPASGEPAWTSVFRPAKPMWASVTGVGFSPQHAPLRPDELATSCRLRPRRRAGAALTLGGPGEIPRAPSRRRPRDPVASLPAVLLLAAARLHCVGADPTEVVTATGRNSDGRIPRWRQMGSTADGLGGGSTATSSFRSAPVVASARARRAGSSYCRAGSGGDGAGSGSGALGSGLPGGGTSGGTTAAAARGWARAARRRAPPPLCPAAHGGGSPARGHAWAQLAMPRGGGGSLARSRSSAPAPGGDSPALANAWEGRGILREEGREDGS